MHVRTVVQAFGVKQHLSNINYLRLEGHIENRRGILWLKYAVAVKSEQRLLKIGNALSQKVLIGGCRAARTGAGDVANGDASWPAADLASAGGATVAMKSCYYHC